MKKMTLIRLKHETHQHASLFHTVFDSWSKIQSGLFSGNKYDLGDYDQCIGFSYSSNDVGTIQGKQCFIILSPLSQTKLNEHDNAINNSFDWSVM